MPVIPSFTAQRTPQGPRVSPSAFSAVSEEQARGAQNFSAAISDYERQQQAMAAEKERLQRAERDIKVLEATNGIDIDAGEIAESFRERTDYENFDTDIEKHEKSIRDKYMQTAGDDKVLQAAISRTLNAKVSTLRHAVSTKKFDVMKERGLGAFETRLNQSLQDYAGTDPADKQTRELILADVEVGLAQLASHRFIDPAKQEERLQKFINDAEETRAEQLGAASPSSAVKELEGGGFKKLNPLVRQKKIIAFKEKMKEENADKSFSRQMQSSGGNLFAMNRYYNNPDNWQKDGINGHQARSIQAGIRAQIEFEREQEKRRKEIQAEAEAESITNFIINGDFNGAKKSLDRSSNIDSRARLQFDDSIRNRTFQTNPKLVNATAAEIEKGIITDSSQIRSRLGSGHSIEDVNGLINKLNNIKEKGLPSHNYFEDAGVMFDRLYSENDEMKVQKPIFVQKIRELAAKENLRADDPAVLEIIDKQLSTYDVVTKWYSPSTWDNKSDESLFKKELEEKKKGTAEEKITMTDEERKAVDDVYDNNSGKISRTPKNDAYILEQIRKAGK